MVELMAACLTGATPGATASSFVTTEGGPPRTGQFFIAIDPAATARGHFSERLDAVCRAFTQGTATRLPGSRRQSARERNLREGVAVDRTLYEQVCTLANGAEA